MTPAFFGWKLRVPKENGSDLFLFFLDVRILLVAPFTTCQTIYSNVEVETMYWFFSLVVSAIFASSKHNFEGLDSFTFLRFILCSVSFCYTTLACVFKYALFHCYPFFLSVVCHTAIPLLFS